MATTTKKVIKNKSTLTNNKGKTEPGKDGKKKDKKTRSREFSDALIYAAIVAFIIKIFFFEAYRIPTGSMENTLTGGRFFNSNKIYIRINNTAEYSIYRYKITIFETTRF